MASSIGTWRPVPPAAPRRGQSQPQPRQVPRHCCPSLQPESRPFDLSCPPPRLLENYNSLKDKHLAEYFNNTRIRQHLQRSGLISRSGRIIPEKEYRLNAIREEHLRYIREYLAGTLLGKPLDTEHHDHPGAKKQPGKNVKKAKPREVKAKPSRRPVGNTRFTYFPHPPPGPSNRRGLFPPLGRDPAGRSRGRTYRRPHTAPGYVRHTLRFPPLPVRAAAEAVKTPTSEKKCLSPQISQQPAGRERSEVRGPNVMEYVTDISPIINMSLMPVPPPPQQKAGKAVRRGRRLRPITAPSEAEQPPRKSSGVSFRSPVRSDVCVTMAFVGKNVRLFGNGADDRNEIAVYQQHCGGENLCVYKGSLLEGETFQFISRRHQGFPFSLTLFVNGLPVDRLSCCCEFKHQRPFTVGGRHGHFRFLSVEGASPCYRCIIARDLDKTQLPPKEKMEEDHEEDHMGSRADGVCVANGECIEPKCDEDIESEERRIDDQINGTSESPSGDKKTDLDIEKECETLSEKALEVSDSKKDEDDSYSDSDFQDDEQASLSQAEADEEKTDPEDLTAREDTGSLDTTAIRHQSPEVPGELKQAESVESLLEEDTERDASSRGDDGEDLMPSESSVSEAEDSDGERPESDKWSILEDYSPVQAETATAAGHGHHVNSEPDDSCTDVEEEIVASGECEASEAPDGTVLAEGTRTLDVQEAAEKVAQERQMVAETQALEEADFVEEEEEVCTKEAQEKVEWVGDLLPQEEEVAVLQAEGQLVVEESAPEESAVAEGHPKVQGTGKGREIGTEVALGEQGILVEGMESEADLKEQGPREEELSGAGEELGREEGRMQPEGRGGAEDFSESEEEDSEVEESEREENLEERELEGKDVRGAVCVGEENLEKGEFEGKDVASAVCVGEENLEKGEFEGKDVASAVCVGEENLEKGEFEGKDVASAVCVGEENLEKGEFEGKDVASAVCVGEENLEKGEFEGKDVASAVCVGEENLEKGEFEGKDVASAVCVGEENLEKGEFEGKDVASAVCVGEENLEKGEFEGKDVASAVCVGEENLEKGEFEGKDVASAVCVGEENLEKGEFEGKDVASAVCVGEENLEKGEFEGKDVASAVCVGEENLEKGEFEGKDVASAVCVGEENLEKGEFEGKDVVSAVCVGEENLEKGELEGKDLVPIELSDEEEDMEERGFSREYMLGGVPEAVEDVDEGGFAGKDVVAILVSGGDDTEEGAFAGKDTVTGAVAEREEMGEGGFAGEDDAGMARAESGGGGEAICGAAGSRELGREGSLESGEQR
uniref:DUF4590 domain-containing protein n=1 Tax=Otus sunia TaxID=257818 RepID=A0A8C8BUH0_9STRI